MNAYIESRALEEHNDVSQSEEVHWSMGASLQYVQVDEYCKSVSADNIWAIGDVSTAIPLTPVARMEGTQFALRLFG